MICFVKFFFNKTQSENNLSSSTLNSELQHSSLEDVDSLTDPPKWPVECQVLRNRVKHIHYVPPTPEPYYRNFHKQRKFFPPDNTSGKVVYDYDIPNFGFFHKSKFHGYDPNSSIGFNATGDSLKFESRFESGNLKKAVQVNNYYYELHLRSDLYSNRSRQWYYFGISNMKKFAIYRFAIVNLTKEDSLYRKGLKPLLYSTKDERLKNIGWRRCGNDIEYFPNKPPGDPSTNTLTFTIMFPYDNDIVYLAYCYPYTYTNLQKDLSKLCKDPVKSSFTNFKVLCKTLAGNNLYCLTITAPEKSDLNEERKSIVISARVHPSETPASWIMKGILEFLTGDSKIAQDLRKRFVFVLVPMLNPDGVIVGNSRYSLAGKDLNRQYKIASRVTTPTVWNLKLIIQRMIKERGVELYCDLHAHSRKHNIFMFGCNNKNRAKDSEVQMFPLMLHQKVSDMFSWESCFFRIEKIKEGTARAVMWKMGILNSFTMEASFGGSLLGDRSATHFSVADYEQVGHYFCKTLLDYYNRPTTKKARRVGFRLICIPLVIFACITLLLLLLYQFFIHK